MKDFKPNSILSQIEQAAQGKRSVGATQANSKQSSGNLLQQADRLLKGQQQPPEESPYQDYDFCHHCKQLKNKYLLVSCKYSSKQAGKNQSGGVYTPYPYEPQFNTVNNVRIYNSDLQNKA